jgi:hypothetical protein
MTLGVSCPGTDIPRVGDRTQISYITRALGGPIHPGEEDRGSLAYQGIEGDYKFSGKDIQLQEGPLGTLLTVVLRLRGDTGGLTITILIPQAIDVTREDPVTFQTLGALFRSPQLDGVSMT